jgi:DNA-binding transcriptional regulator PaaX
LVIYDIPHSKKAARDALRRKLRELGFFEWQKSVFIYPYPCREQIDFIIEFFDIRPYVRQADIINPTNEAELLLHFGLK